MAQELALATIRKNQPKLEALTTKVKAINKEIMANFKNAVVGAKEAGKWLLDMKELLPHGHFESYVEDNTAIAGRTARRYMQLHERWDEIEDKLGPDAYVSTIDGCLRIVAPPPKRPALADFPPTEVSDETCEIDGEGSDGSDGGLSSGVEQAAHAIRQQRAAMAAREDSGNDNGERTKAPKDPIKACEEDLERLFGELTRRLEDYYGLKENRLNFDCQQSLDHCYGDFRKWKRAPKNS